MSNQVLRLKLEEIVEITSDVAPPLFLEWSGKRSGATPEFSKKFEEWSGNWSRIFWKRRGVEW